eukprot:42300-Chlamydomonas_euryale.AAC.3
MEEHEEAEELQQEAVKLCERNLGHEHPMTASCLSNLAEMMGQRGDMQQAEALARDALAIRTKVGLVLWRGQGCWGRWGGKVGRRVGG